MSVIGRLDESVAEVFLRQFDRHDGQTTHEKSEHPQNDSGDATPHPGSPTSAGDEGSKQHDANASAGEDDSLPVWLL